MSKDNEVTPGTILAQELQAVLGNNRFWPDEKTFQLSHQIMPIPATEVAVVQNGKLLLQYRLFDEWPIPYNNPGWYIPGGYVPWGASLEEACAVHLRKDLAGEQKRTGISQYPNTIKLGPPVVIGEKKWMPGEHPFGCPVSLICVCELIEGTIVETDWLKWSDQTVPTQVPHHQKFQDMVFAWINTPAEYRNWLIHFRKLLSEGQFAGRFSASPRGAFLYRLIFYI